MVSSALLSTQLVSVRPWRWAHGTKRLDGRRRGFAASEANLCRRNYARSVEKIVLLEGYDGYMRKDAWAGEVRCVVPCSWSPSRR